MTMSPKDPVTVCTLPLALMVTVLPDWETVTAALAAVSVMSSSVKLVIQRCAMLTAEAAGGVTGGVGVATGAAGGVAGGVGVATGVTGALAWLAWRAWRRGSGGRT